MRAIAERWGYEEVKTPAFENVELFTIKSGEAILGELYAFKDKCGREIALFKGNYADTQIASIIYGMSRGFISYWLFYFLFAPTAWKICYAPWYSWFQVGLRSSVDGSATMRRGRCEVR